MSKKNNGKNSHAGGPAPKKVVKKSVNDSSDAHNELKELMKKNLAASNEIIDQNNKINRRLTMLVIGGYIKLLLVLIPLILAIIFLPPIFKDFWQQFQNIMGESGPLTTGVFSDLTSDQIKSILKAIEQ